MPKLTEEQVLGLLTKAIEGGDAADETPNNDASAKAIAKLEKAVSNLTSFVAKNVHIEAPKSIEEIIAENNKSLLAEVAKMVKPAEKPSEEPKPVAAMTAKELSDMIAKQVTDTVTALVVKKGEPEGEISAEEAIDEVLGALAKSEGIDLSKELPAPAASKKKIAKEEKPAVNEYTCEKEAANGATLSKEARDSRQSLDDFIGAKMSQEFATRHIGNKEDDE
jgi:hypothetical protein